MIHLYHEKEPDRKTRSAKRKSTDALTSAGYELFEKLRALRLTIAREESLPPYIIFNDKTLIDMCMKLPGSKPEMLNVSGVGTAKYEKYGQRFLEAIGDYRLQHPSAVVSITENGEEAASAPEIAKVNQRTER